MITSTSNEKIKEIKKLKMSKNNIKEKKFIVEGRHLVLEALKCNILLETFSLEEFSCGVSNTVVSDNVMKAITSLNSSSNVIGICKMILEDEKLGNKIILLDGVQDPGNLGTIIRSACAFGFSSIILSPNCVNKYNDKVIRSTQGMLFKVNVITKNLNEIIPVLKNDGYDLYGTDVNSGIDIKSVKSNGKIAVIMGSEGTGISSDIKKLISKNIYINTSSDCESLNVAVASSIIMHQLS